MLETLIAVLALTAPPPAPPLATHPTVQEEEATPADPIQAVIDEYDAAYKQFMKLYRAAEKDDRSAVREEHRPSSEEYAARVLALVEEHAGTEPSLSGLLWVVQNTRDDDLLAKAGTAIEKDHMGSERLGPLCSTLTRNAESGERLLVLLLEKSPHDTVRGAACYSLGRLFMHKAGREGSAEASEEARLAALEFFERIEDEFAEIESGRRGTLGEAAERNLFQLNNLQIGMIAPDIEGPDLDGVEFKLSDYRGKVVVIDFWGDW